MEPTYNPISFKQIDLRRYHIKDMNDVIKFHEFVISRLEECRQVERTANNRLSTLESINEQYKKKAMKNIVNYGNPTVQAAPETPAGEEIKVESVNVEHERLFDEIRKASANTEIVEEEKEISSLGDNPDERKTAEIEFGYDLYRITDGKKRIMVYKNGRLMKTDDVPAKVLEDLMYAIGKNPDQQVEDGE